MFTKASILIHFFSSISEGNEVWDIFLAMEKKMITFFSPFFGYYDIIATDTEYFKTPSRSSFGKHLFPLKKANLKTRDWQLLLKEVMNDNVQLYFLKLHTWVINGIIRFMEDQDEFSPNFLFSLNFCQGNALIPCHISGIVDSLLKLIKNTQNYDIFPLCSIPKNRCRQFLP